MKTSKPVKRFSLSEKTGKLESHKIKGLLNKGVQPVFKLTTESGKSIRTTGNHLYLTKNGWQKVSQLQPGNEIAVPNLPLFDRESVNNISQSNSNGYYSTQNVEEGHTPKNLVHNYLEKTIAKYKNTINKITPPRELKKIREISPVEKIGLTNVLGKNPFATSLQKLETTFNWLGLENNSINSNNNISGIDVKNDIKFVASNRCQFYFSTRDGN